mmetsp:Transcript_15577/g.34372  ORF Transcript_15577/g.34372 Transcript_15577/m.34372 type:complete len:105 (+) Transcript_15577:553-867(+)
MAALFCCHGRTSKSDIHKQKFDSMLTLLFKTAKGTAMLALEKNGVNLSLYDIPGDMQSLSARRRDSDGEVFADHLKVRIEATRCEYRHVGSVVSSVCHSCSWVA